MILDILKVAIGPIIKPLIDRIPDKNERARAEEDITNKLIEATSTAVQGQIKINETQAQHGSVFVAGARPAIMWICAAALGWNYLVQPLFMWGAFLYGVDLDDAPTLDLSELMPILLGLLGLGAYRSYEKKHGVARNAINGN